MSDSLIIIGCNFSGLYSAIRCIDSGIRVTLIEKKYKYKNDIINYKIFNKTHIYYIQLLNRFSIKYSNYNLNFNEKIKSIINTINNKAKHIPNKILNTQSFDKLCSTILSLNDYTYLHNNINNYLQIYPYISGLFGISLFNKELINNTFYIVDDESSVIIEKMVSFILNNKGNIIYNTEVKDITNDNSNIIITTNNLSNKYQTSKNIIFTLSKDNLLKFKYFSKDKRKIFTNLLKYNIDPLCIYNDEYILNEYNIQNHLINNMNIVYPIKKYSLYLWDIGINNIIIREKIKKLYNNIFICSDFHSKNIFFANYTLENYEEIHNKIINKFLIL